MGLMMGRQRHGRIVIDVFEGEDQDSIEFKLQVKMNEDHDLDIPQVVKAVLNGALDACEARETSPVESVH